MKLYLASLAAGVLVGVLYALMGVRSPAPPVVALLGLLGMLAGEQIPGAVRQIIKGERPVLGASTADVVPTPPSACPTEEVGSPPAKHG